MGSRTEDALRAQLRKFNNQAREVRDSFRRSTIYYNREIRRAAAHLEQLKSEKLKVLMRKTQERIEADAAVKDCQDVIALIAPSQAHGNKQTKTRKKKVKRGADKK